MAMNPPTTDVGVLYAGVGLAGRRSCMQIVNSLISGATALEVALDAEGGHQVSFEIHSLPVRVRVEAITGASYRQRVQSEQRRRASVVIVLVDSQTTRMPANVTFCRELFASLGRDKPVVMQFHKQDLVGLTPVEELSATINFWQAPEFLSSTKDPDSIVNPFLTALLLATSKLDHPISIRDLIS